MAGREYVSRFDWKISPEEQRRRDEIAQGIVQDELSAAQDVGDARSAVFLQQELSNRFKSGRVASPQSSTVESTDALFSAPEDAGGWKTIDPGWTRKSAPSDDGWTNVSDKYFYVGAKEGAQPTSGSFLSDTGNLAKIGVNQVASGLREAVRQIPGVGDSLVAGADAVDKFVTGKTSGEIFKDDNERAQGALSPNMRSALDKKWWDEENGKLGDAWLDPRAYYGGIVQSLPGTVLTMIPAGRLAKMAYEAKLATLGAEEAAKVSARTAMVAGGVGEGVLSAGQTAGDVREELAKLPQSVWDSSEAYKALIDSGMKPDEAKASLTNDAATKGFLIAGVTTALFGGQGDRVLAQAMRGSIKGGLVKRGLVGAVGEGGEEFGQSYTQEIAKNVGVQTVDPTRSATQGAMNSALGGLATGAVQGAGMNMLLGRSEPTASTVPLDQAADAPITPVISPQEIAAITPAAPVLSARETRQQAVSEQVDNLPPQREASNREARQQAVADAVTPLPDQRAGTPSPVTQPFTDAQIAASEQAIRARQVAEFDPSATLASFLA